MVFDIHTQSLYFPLRPAEDALHLSVGAGREESGAAAATEGGSPFILGSGPGPMWESPHWAPGATRVWLQLWRTDGAGVGGIPAFQVCVKILCTKMKYNKAAGK